MSQEADFEVVHEVDVEATGQEVAVVVVQVEAVVLPPEIRNAITSRNWAVVTLVITVSSGMLPGDAQIEIVQPPTLLYIVHTDTLFLLSHSQPQLNNHLAATW